MIACHALESKNITAGYGGRKHTHHDRFTLQNSLSLDIMNSTYFWTRSFLLRILLVSLLMIIILLIHRWYWTIVMLWKTWEVSIMWWVVGTITSDIRLSYIGRNCSGSNWWLLLATLLRWTIGRTMAMLIHEPLALIIATRVSHWHKFTFSLSLGADDSPLQKR